MDIVKLKQKQFLRVNIAILVLVCCYKIWQIV